MKLFCMTERLRLLKVTVNPDAVLLKLRQANWVGLEIPKQDT